MAGPGCLFERIVPHGQELRIYGTLRRTLGIFILYGLSSVPSFAESLLRLPLSLTKYGWARVSVRKDSSPWALAVEGASYNFFFFKLLRCINVLYWLLIAQSFAYYRYYGTKIMRISFQILPCISLLHVNV